ncbi:hypothetical protein Tco_0788683 [Tanacetum coccineum]
MKTEKLWVTAAIQSRLLRSDVKHVWCTLIFMVVNAAIGKGKEAICDKLSIAKTMGRRNELVLLPFNISTAFEMLKLFVNWKVSTAVLRVIFGYKFVNTSG